MQNLPCSNGTQLRPVHQALVTSVGKPTPRSISADGLIRCARHQSRTSQSRRELGDPVISRCANPKDAQTQTVPTDSAISTRESSTWLTPVRRKRSETVHRDAQANRGRLNTLGCALHAVATCRFDLMKNLERWWFATVNHCRRISLGALAKVLDHPYRLSDQGDRTRGFRREFESILSILWSNRFLSRFLAKSRLFARSP